MYLVTINIVNYIPNRLYAKYCLRVPHAISTTYNIHVEVLAKIGKVREHVTFL